MNSSPYNPEKRRTHLSQAGAAKIGEAQRNAKLERLVRGTGLDREEIERRLELGMSWCKAHGWRALRRCDQCKIRYIQASRQRKQAGQVVAELRQQSPALGAKVQTGRELEAQAGADRQLELRFEPTRARRVK